MVEAWPRRFFTAVCSAPAPALASPSTLAGGGGGAAGAVEAPRSWVARSSGLGTADSPKRPYPLLEAEIGARPARGPPGIRIKVEPAAPTAALVAALFFERQAGRQVAKARRGM